MNFIQAVLVLVQFYSRLWLANIYLSFCFIGPLFLAARYLLNIYSVYVFNFFVSVIDLLGFEPGSGSVKLAIALKLGIVVKLAIALPGGGG